MNKLLLLVVFALSFSVLFTSCLSIKPGGVKSGKRYYETFFVGEEGTQYFIKPIELEAEDGTSTLEMDFSFRYKNNLQDSVIVKFSLLRDTVIRRIEGLQIQAGQEVSAVEKITFLFSEKKKNHFVNRFEGRLPLGELDQRFEQHEWTIRVEDQAGQTTYNATKRTQRILRLLDENVFVLFE